MTKCARCKKLLIFFDFKIWSYLPSSFTRYGVGNFLCYKCNNELFEEYKKEHIKVKKYTEIECPDCGQKFIVVAKKPKKTDELLLPWVLIQFKRNNPYVHCPYCQIKLPPDEIVD